VNINFINFLSEGSLAIARLARIGQSLFKLTTKKKMRLLAKVLKFKYS